MRKDLFIFILNILLLLEGFQSSGFSACITVMASSDYEIFRLSAQGFWESLRQKSYVDGDLEENLIFTEGRVAESIAEVRKRNPDLIFTLGNNSTRAACEQLSDVPIVFAIVSDPVYLEIIVEPEKPREFFSGVTADIPIQTKLEIISRVFGRPRVIGTMYSNGKFLNTERMKRELKSYNIGVNAQLVRMTGDIIREARNLSTVDLFWMVPDPAIYTQSSMESLFRWLKDRNIPILVPSPRFLSGKNGGDIAVTVDPKQSGQQAAEIAIKFLSGKAAVVPIQPPHGVAVYMNKKFQARAPEGTLFVE